jgi:hypothetical protein
VSVGVVDIVLLEVRVGRSMEGKGKAGCCGERVCRGVGNEDWGL